MIKETFFNPPNYLGSLSPASEEMARELAQALTAANLATDYIDDTRAQVWEKAILNACMSPISALTGLNMEQAMEFEPTLTLSKELLRECVEAARAEGIPLPTNFREMALRYLSMAGPHKPSMLIDVEDHRKTEIEFLNKRIVEYGEKLGIATPVNAIITTLIDGVDHVNTIRRKE